LSSIIIAGLRGDICSLSDADVLANANSDYRRRKKGRQVLGFSPKMA
jgi:hypothetical protein